MARNEEDRPVHLVIDVSKNTSTEVPVTDEEWDELERAGQENLAAQQAAAADDDALRAAVQGHPDPVVQALARRAGLV